MWLTSGISICHLHFKPPRPTRPRRRDQDPIAQAKSAQPITRDFPPSPIRDCVNPPSPDRFVRNACFNHILSVIVFELFLDIFTSLRIHHPPFSAQTTTGLASVAIPFIQPANLRRPIPSSIVREHHQRKHPAVYMPAQKEYTLTHRSLVSRGLRTPLQ